MLLANKIFKAMLSKWNKNFEFRFESCLFFFYFPPEAKRNKKISDQILEGSFDSKNSFFKIPIHGG